MERDGHYYIEEIDKYFIFEIVYVMDLKAKTMTKNLLTVRGEIFEF